METIIPLITLGYITRNKTETNNVEKNSFKQLHIDRFQTSGFNNLMIDNYKKKLFLKVSDNYFESIKPNPIIINKEWRYENRGYKSVNNDIIRKNINDDLMYLENFKNIDTQFNFKIYIISLIIIFIVIMKIL